MDAVTRRTNAFIAELGAMIRELRVSKGLSQTELAARAGLSQPSVGYIENGTRHPSLDSLSRLAIALEMTVSQITAKAERRLPKEFK